MSADTDSASAGGDVQDGRRWSRRGVGALFGAAVASTAVAGRAAADSPPEREFHAEAGPGTSTGPTGPTGPTRGRPNVLVVLADDMGWADLSCYGSPDIRTPHLDALARQGVRFTNGYAAAAQCSPTRFALYTGRFPGRLRGGLAEPIASRDEREGIPADHPTLASLLRAAGYRTAMHGKWHCGFLPWYSPTRCGWEEFFGNFAGALDYYSKVNHLGEHDLYEGEVPVRSLAYYTDALTDRTVEFLRRPHDRPWLLNLNFTTPHSPWEAPGDTAVSEELTRRQLAGDRWAMFHVDGGSLTTYVKMVESLDTALGRVFRALRESGQERNTLVLFASDNGGERFSYQWPLSGAKDSLLEGGIRVPTILRWPARVPGGQVRHAPVVTQDWTATILEVAGVVPAPTHPLDGRSVAGHLLRGEPAPDRDLFWRTRRFRALRRGRWKYYRGPALFSGEVTDHLFDLETDVREQANLAARRPAILADLRARWERIDSELLRYP